MLHLLYLYEYNPLTETSTIYSFQNKSLETLGLRTLSIYFHLLKFIYSTYTLLFLFNISSGSSSCWTSTKGTRTKHFVSIYSFCFLTFANFFCFIYSYVLLIFAKSINFLSSISNSNCFLSYIG